MLAILCSGQGTQHADMFRLTGTVVEAEPIFARAARYLGEDPRQYVSRAAPDQLHANRVAQILCVTQAMAAYVALESALPSRCIVAGYSVGELAAWGVAGLLSEQQIVDIAGIRAQLMTDGSGPYDGLCFVRGIGRKQLEVAAQAHRAEIAIVNPNDTYVLGGLRADLEAFCARARVEGAERAALLDVNVASHTSRLESVVPKFLHVLNAAGPGPMRRGIVLMSALSAAPVLSSEVAAEALAAEIGETLRWSDTLNSMYERGVRTFLELGPGKALADMIGHIGADAEARSIDDFRTIDGVIHWIDHRTG